MNAMRLPFIKAKDHGAFNRASNVQPYVPKKHKALVFRTAA